MANHDLPFASGSSRQWLARDAAHLIHPQHDQQRADAAPVWIRGQGATLVDCDGREVLDGLSGLWNVLLGYGRDELIEAAAAQMQRLSFAPVYAGSTHDRAIELAERLAKLCYTSIDDFFFCTSGSEAIETAIKTARYYWSVRGQAEKNVILSRHGGYHGTTLAALAASGQPNYRAHFEPLPEGFVQIAAPQGPHDLASATASIEAIERHGADRIAALLAEPIQVAAGTILPPSDYWREMRELCTRHNILLVSDEIVTSLGRTGDWMGLTRFGIEPDMVVLGKGLSSGYVPLSAVGFNRSIAATIRTGGGSTTWMHAGTNSAHPVAAAVAMANLDLLQQGGYLVRARQLATVLRQALEPLLALDCVAAIRCIGLTAAIEFHPAEPALGVRVQQTALREGLFSRARGDVFHLAPCYACSDVEILSMVSRLRAAIEMCSK